MQYYNDSKATNVDAAIKALESFPANVHLILGGKDKESDYSELSRSSPSASSVYTIGAAAAKIESQIGNSVPVVSPRPWKPRSGRPPISAVGRYRAAGARLRQL